MQKTHLAISSVCAVGALALGIVQTFDLVPRHENPGDVAGPAAGPASVAEPAAVAAAMPKADAPADMAVVTPSAAAAGPDTSRLRFHSGTPDDAPLPFDAASLFDGRAETAATLAAGNGIDFIVEFAEPSAFTITGLQYTQPATAGGRVRSLDVMVIPDGDGSPGGQQVLSFPLSTAEGVQSLRIPPTSGKGFWLRFAGAPGESTLAMGDLKVETAP